MPFLQSFLYEKHQGEALQAQKERLQQLIEGASIGKQ